MSALVTNAKNRIAYNIVRSLGKKGIPVYTSDFVSSSMSFFSRYSKGHFLYPSPYRKQEDFIVSLIQNCKRLKTDVLIPVFEESFLIAKHKEKIENCVRVVLPDYEQILFAHNKDRWEPLARRLGIPVPETFPIADLQSGKRCLSDLNYPVLMKPKQGGGAWAITQANSERELQILLAKATNEGLPWERFFCQEKISGETHCVAMLFNHGEMRAKVAYRQLRDYPVTGGQATLRVSIRSEAAEGHLQRLLEEMNWHGVCQADFIVDERTREPYLIDINPRFWGSLTQAIASGVDFPYLLYRIAVNGDVEPQTAFKTGVATRWIGGDLRGFLPLLRMSRFKAKFAKEFFFPSTGVELYDDFSWGDPLPFFAWCADAVLKMVRNRSLQPVAHDSLEGVWE